MIKRLGVFVFYEKDGIVRRYVSHILSEIKKHLSGLVIICNGKLTEESHSVLEEFSDEIYIRENKGYDAGALKYFFCGQFSNERLEDLDEILIFNHTFYGPFGGFGKVFEKMDERDCDFWGMTDYNENDLFPYHLQSYFINFRSRLIHSGHFMEFWNGLKGEYVDLAECVKQYEVAMTRFFLSKGFKSSSYTENELKANVSFLHPYELMVRQGYPLIKRKLFIFEMNDLAIYNYEFNALMDHVRINYNKEYLDMCEDVISSFDICAIKEKAGLSIIPNDDHGTEDGFAIISDDPGIKKAAGRNAQNELPPAGLCSLIYYPKDHNLSVHDEIMLYDNSFRNMDYAGKVSRIFTDRPEIGCLLPEFIADPERLYEFEREYVSYGAFWIRNSILESLNSCGVSVKDLVEMEGNELARLIQKQGYFTYVIKNKEYDDAENVMKNYVIKKLLFHLGKNYDFNSLEDLIGKLYGDRLHGKRIRKIVKDRLNI